MNEGCKWMEMFEDARTVIFCVALSDYDQLAVPVHGSCKPLQNKMMQTKELFENTVKYGLVFSYLLVNYSKLSSVYANCFVSSN